ncbi:MAG: histidinol-phosphate transaminase [candidate division NC10 bacterium]|nr:histidinol-phosphate transaminase [candidate division NC10 bacterium]
MKRDWESLLRPSVGDLVPYPVEKCDSAIKMDANEYPYPWPPELLRAVMAEMGKVDWNRYPDPCAEGLRQILSRQLQVSPSQIMVGNGSDELIQCVLLAFGGPQVKVLFPVPTFAMYEIISRSTGCQFVGVPLGPELDLDEAAMEEAIRREEPRLLFLAYPNNPTGNCFRRSTMEALLEGFEGIVVIDEAYFDFSGKTFLDHLGRHQHLLILRTLSKIGLAGLRVGIAIGSEPLIQMVSRVRLPYNLNTFSQVAASVVLSRNDFMKRQVKTLIRERERLFLALRGMEGISPYPSEANFLLFRAKEGRRIFEGLLSRGIRVRAFGPEGRLRDHLRVTVGRPEENDLFLRAMEELCRKGEQP